jgi:type I restriction enzyme S subunit
LKQEQTAIATILSDMDSEIAKLSEKLNKLRHIKQGMMSELLTGRRRLIENETIDTVAQKSISIEHQKPITKIIEFPEVIANQIVADKGKHNQQFEEAVMMSALVNTFATVQFPLGRFRLQKFLYFIRRHQNQSTDMFKKQAAGPYSETARYKGGEKIALKNGYIELVGNSKFKVGVNIEKALEYLTGWGKVTDIKWVEDNLKYRKNDVLELLATVDMAICDLKRDNKPINIYTIKQLIASDKKWKKKFEKPIFDDNGINWAINELQRLLPDED